MINLLKNRFPWDKFISAMKHEGFMQINSLKSPQSIGNKGYSMLVGVSIQSGAIRDPSHLHLPPYLIFRPHTENQLRSIVVNSQSFQIPITFSSGKTGLSGGYANFAIVVDLEDLHSFPESISLDIEQQSIVAEQSVLVSDLIKKVLHASNRNLIFPIQPASALKLPVRVGGMIASNASGVISGKLGAVKDWIRQMRVMTPKGKIRIIGKKDPLFNKIVGGNGYYGIILSATFQLYEPPEHLKQAILFGEDIDSAFNGLQVILDQKLFLHVSEFVMSPMVLTEKFNSLAQSTRYIERVKWAALLQGAPEKLTRFIEIMKENTTLGNVTLNEQQFDIYLDERAKMALLSFSGAEEEDYLKVPGCEDILAEPKYLPQIIRDMNIIFEKHGFKKIMYGYGHINFRKGKGLLLHARLPVPVSFFYDREKKKKMELIGRTIYKLIDHLKTEYNIRQKAEHSPGPFQIWLNTENREILSSAIEKNEAFANPHLILFNEVSKKYDNIQDIFINLMIRYLD
ncbi:MAG: FAD-binding oxidoreductase [Promethearchaeia archaeon]